MAHFGKKPADNFSFRTYRRVARNDTVQAQDPETHVQVFCAGVYWNSYPSGALDKPGPVSLQQP